MASSKARSRSRSAAARNGTATRGSRPSSRTGGAASPAATRAQQRRQPVTEPVEQPPAGPPTWLKIATFLLAIAGLGVSIYLTYTHYSESALLGCAESGTVNCTKVTTSSQSMIFGVIPVAVTGLVYYVFMMAIMSPWAWKSSWEWMPRLRLATVISGVGMVLYLVYAEIFQIDAICLYCTSVHVITFLIFALVVVSAAIWGLPPPAPPPRAKSPGALPLLRR
jgi:uncharacterized membrane protein